MLLRTGRERTTCPAPPALPYIEHPCRVGARPVSLTPPSSSSLLLLFFPLAFYIAFWPILPLPAHAQHTDHLSHLNHLKHVTRFNHHHHLHPSSLWPSPSPSPWPSLQPRFTDQMPDDIWKVSTSRGVCLVGDTYFQLSGTVTSTLSCTIFHVFCTTPHVPVLKKRRKNCVACRCL